MKGFKRGYCKYCYKEVPLIIDWADDLVKCSFCDYGLAPLGWALEYESYNKWYKDIQYDFKI